MNIQKKGIVCEGLVAHLIGITTPEQVARDPLPGGLYENLLMLEFFKSRLNQGLRPDFYFYRDSRGNEVDLVIRDGKKLIPVEIKSAATFTKDFLNGIKKFREVVGSRCTGGAVLYNGDQRLQFEGVQVFNPFVQEGMHSL